ncbi:ycf20-like protein isoform X1 [Eucalyptus grandis]|nr:ycf20-like protein isoform X1 [Eucalyptus grandis]
MTVHAGLCFMMAATAISPHMPANVKLSSLRYPWSGVAVVGLAGCFHTAAYAFGQKLRSQIYILHVTRPSLVNDFKNMTWAIRSSADGRGLDLDPSTDSTNGTTRLIRAIRDFQNKLSAKVQQIRKNFPMKLLFFLVGFYCATAFATVIGQTGDWDILSAALAVVVVEGIGALMYSASQPVFSRARSLISMFNYWKAGLSLGLFLDSFKY